MGVQSRSSEMSIRLAPFVRLGCQRVSQQGWSGVPPFVAEGERMVAIGRPYGAASIVAMVLLRYVHSRAAELLNACKPCARILSGGPGRVRSKSPKVHRLFPESFHSKGEKGPGNVVGTAPPIPRCGKPLCPAQNSDCIDNGPMMDLHTMRRCRGLPTSRVPPVLRK